MEIISGEQYTRWSLTGTSLVIRFDKPQFVSSCFFHSHAISLPPIRSPPCLLVCLLVCHAHTLPLEHTCTLTRAHTVCVCVFFSSFFWASTNLTNELVPVLYRCTVHMVHFQPAWNLFIRFLLLIWLLCIFHNLPLPFLEFSVTPMYPVLSPALLLLLWLLLSLSVTSYTQWAPNTHMHLE